MTEPNDLKASRREAAQLLGFGDDPSRLCPADRLKVDLVSTLRLVIDHAGEVVLEGGTADLGRLVTAVEHLTRLLPAAREPPPTRDDPRVVLWNMLKEGRDRLAEGFEGYDGKCRQIEALQAELAAKDAEIAALKSAPGSAPALPGVPTLVERMPAPASNVVALPKPPSAPVPFAEDPRNYVLPDGSISPRPIGGGRRYWGPVGS
jgi:hypothetical protein